MSLPNSEPLPESINELPPARQRHIRRQPRSASLAERQLLLESLLTLTAPTLDFFLLSLIGSIAAGAALYFDDPAILVFTLVLLPFIKPVFDLALLPASRKVFPRLKSLISLAILFALVIAAGVLAGWLRKEFPPTNIPIFRFSAPYWLDLVIVGVSAIMGVFVMIRKGDLPRLIGVLLAFEILFPLAIAGFSFPLGASQLFPGAFLVSLTHLGLAVLLATITFFALGFSPNNLKGWAFLLLPVLLILGGLLLNLPKIPGFTSKILEPSPTPNFTATASNTPLPQATASRTVSLKSPTRTASPSLTTTPSPSETQTPTQTQTPEPTTYLAIVEAENGAVIRESPTFDAPVVGYLDNNDAIEVFDVTTSQEGSLWYRVSSPDGQNGWLLASLVNTQTPTPTPE